MRAIQDLYPDDFAHCYGCGRNNSEGHQLKSFVEGGEVVLTSGLRHITSLCLDLFTAVFSRRSSTVMRWRRLPPQRKLLLAAK